MARTETNRTEGPHPLGAVARVQGTIVQAGPLLWAQSMHTQWSSGLLAPKNRHDNPLKLRAMIRAIRLLEQSTDAKDRKKAGDLSRFLGTVWGVTKACEAVAEGECQVADVLREAWGDVQLPPAGAMVNERSADELLIAAAVRRLG